ncbi:MAG: hypothetical protein ACH350_09495 [Parachlamydiaceae bacterium]
MMNHTFIFNSGVWLGEGKITLTVSPECLTFFTKWEIKEQTEGVMTATQIVEIEGMEERMINCFTFKEIVSTTFGVFLENHLVGSVIGQGVLNDLTIKWMYHTQSNFEGFEIYEKQKNGNYFFHAEYGAPDEYQTRIEGLIWSKSI